MANTMPRFQLHSRSGRRLVDVQPFTFALTAALVLAFVAGGLVAAVEVNVSTALFEFLRLFPWATAVSILALIMVVVFFVTSSDSGSLVIDIITSGGQTEPPTAQRVFWAITEGAVAVVLLLGGGLVALQSVAIASGLPLAILLLIMIGALVRGLQTHVAEGHLDLRPAGEREGSDRGKRSGQGNP